MQHQDIKKRQRAHLYQEQKTQVQERKAKAVIGRIESVEQLKKCKKRKTEDERIRKMKEMCIQVMIRLTFMPVLVKTKRRRLSLRKELMK